MQTDADQFTPRCPRFVPNRTWSIRAFRCAYGTRRYGLSISYFFEEKMLEATEIFRMALEES